MNGNESDSDDRTPARKGRDPHRTVPSAQDTDRNDPGAAPARIGRYQIDHSLGAGGFGNVLLGYDPQLHRRVAIKVPHAHLVASASDSAAFLAEAQALAALDHPHIVPVYDVGTSDNVPCYVVSKFVDGETLEQRMHSSAYSYHDAAMLTATIAEALHYAHTQGLVHRDIKPSNILLDAKGAPSLVDFGLALREADIGQGPRFAGTPAYMSPEQARGEGHRVDGRSDIYSLGCIFYELLVGRRPFHAPTAVELLELIANHDPKPPRQINDSVPRELERICLKALSRRASDRYTTAKDMADDLRHLLATPSLGTIESQAATNSEQQATLPVAGTSPSRHPTPSDNMLLHVVPRGLRSFDQRDADFFLALVPGLRDRNGLPESIAFWKQHAEETDEDRTFPVGLIYGPSGCGKSSLVKAGLLPRLSGTVTPVLIECSAHDTEQRLRHELCKRSGDGLPEGTLVETVTAIRQGRGRSPDRKLLIVLDQFEQWLHAQGVSERAELVQALRQCDGGRVQAILMIRDDFWMATTRLMQALEVPIQEGQNSASVDLFPVKHSRRVLIAIGRAYGDLPGLESDLNRSQRQFVERAVDGLAEDDKVVCVRLALLAEMVKGKPWTPETLRRFGGTEGLGVAFLDETFGTRTAPPAHRYHERAARQLLESLLPEAGVGIRGQMRSRAELLDASGYGDRPQDFDELMKILDHQLRLITPVDPVEGTEPGDARIQPSTRQSYYQLSHDFLVPPLRTWLTQKRRETRRGRAELCLDERAREWAARPEGRRLPRWWEALSIRLWTDRSRWTEVQRKMMRRATGVYGLRAVTLLVLFAFVLTAGWLVRRSLEQRRERDYAASLVRSLVTADIKNVQAIVDELEQHWALAEAPLRAAHQNAEEDSPKRLRTAIALLRFDDSQVDYLCDQLLSTTRSEPQVLVAALRPHQQLIEGRLWSTLQSTSDGGLVRMRAAAALANYAPADERWSEVRSSVADQMVKVGLVELAQWQAALRGVAQHLLDPLEAIFLDRERDLVERNVATAILATYTAENLPRAAHLLCLADSDQFDKFVPLIEAHPGAPEYLRAVLQEELTHQWRDPAFDPAWKPLESDVRPTLLAANGILDDRFALCQTLRLEEWEALASALTASGYRPIRFRPYQVDDEVLVAAVWHRDGRPWRLAHSSTPGELEQLDYGYRQESFVPADVTCFVNPLGESGAKLQYAGLWVAEVGEAPNRRVLIGVEGTDFHETANELLTEGYSCTTNGGLVTWQDEIHRCRLYTFSDEKYTSREHVASLQDLGENAMPYYVCTDLSLFLSTETGESGAPDVGFSGAWNVDANRFSQIQLPETPDQLAASAAQLIDDGYRPISCSVVSAPSGRLRSASVWHRPTIPETALEALAQRQANAAIALLKLEQVDSVRHLFRHGSAPRVRSYLVDRIGSYGLEPHIILERLRVEDDTSARRALLLALAEIGELRTSDPEHHQRVELLSKMLHEDVDAGIHSAAQLVLRRWGATSEIDAVKQQLATGRREGDRNWYVSQEGLTFVILGPVESFLMGSPPYEPGRLGGPAADYEKPHYQQVGRRFAISTCEVTNEQFDRYWERSEELRIRGENPKSPVRYVTWYRAAEYCNWLSEQEGIDQDQWCYLPNEDGEFASGMRPAPDILELTGYRLPTEPEWEYAARSGTTTSRYFGEAAVLLDKYAFCSRPQSETWLPAVGTLLPNDNGLFDMYGNMFEWCQNRFIEFERDFTQPTPDQISLDAVTDTDQRSVRGGCYLDSDMRVRSAFRRRYGASRVIANAGFRVARTINLEEN